MVIDELLINFLPLLWYSIYFADVKQRLTLTIPNFEDLIRTRQVSNEKLDIPSLLFIARRRIFPDPKASWEY